MLYSIVRILWILNAILGIFLVNLVDSAQLQSVHGRT
jgi:hypothetical protein